MKIFVSWSGARSKAMAESLRDWLKLVIQAAEPFVSSKDIDKGERGLNVIAAALESAAFGIICVTRENSLAPWINFEAGALSKAFGEARVVPLLLDLPLTDLTGPLTQFQVVSSSNRDDVFAMVRTLRDHFALGNIDDMQLRTTFEAFWPRLEADLEMVRAIETADPTVAPRRTSDEVLEDMLVLVRRQDGVMRAILERVDYAVPMVRITAKEPAEWSRGTRRGLVDELIADLPLNNEHALTYRVITDRDPEEVQVMYQAGAISEDNVNNVCAVISAFVERSGVHVTIKSDDGYQIIASPGREAAVLLPPVEGMFAPGPELVADAPKPTTVPGGAQPRDTPE